MLCELFNPISIREIPPWLIFISREEEDVFGAFGAFEAELKTTLPTFRLKEVNTSCKMALERTH